MADPFQPVPAASGTADLGSGWLMRAHDAIIPRSTDAEDTVTEEAIAAFVSAVNAGDRARLRALFAEHPGLVREIDAFPTARQDEFRATKRPSTAGALAGGDNP